MRHGLPTNLRARTTRESGFSMMELMMAVAVIALVMGAVAAALGSTLNLSRSNKNRVVGANLAAAVIEEIRTDAAGDFTTLSSLTGLQPPETRTVQGVNYTITKEIDPVSAGATGNACDTTGPGSSIAYLRVTIDVTWTNARAVKPVRTQTVITPPVGTYDPSLGNAAVEVLGADGTPRSGVVATLSVGPTAKAPITTTSTGCAFFSFLSPGSYKVKLTAPGYVDSQGIPSPEQTLGVNAASATPFPFVIDQAATLNLNLRGVIDNSGPTYGGAVPTNVAVTLGNSGLQPVGAKTFAGTGANRTIGSLFPFPSGYTAWTGSCVNAEPETYAGATPLTPINAPQGGTESGDIDMAAFKVRVVRSLPLLPPISLAQIRLVNVGAGCPAETLTFAATDVTDLNGDITVAAPFGDWRVEVVGRTAASAWPVVNLDPTDALPRSTTQIEVL